VANITVTYSFTNSTTADATQVNQNFTDIINGTSDGTKDFSISALTVAGTATLNGAVNLGNASSDDITVTGSLASSIPIKTTYSYDLGSATIGLRNIYLGSADAAARTTKIVAGTVASSNTLTLPIITGTLGLQDNYSSELSNLTIACSVGSSALTVAVKTSAASDASASDPIYIGFRNATAATGTYNRRSITGALSLVVSSGSTLGFTSATTEYAYLYALDNAGTVELAIMGGANLVDEGVRQTSTAEGGAGAADTRYTLYSTTARTDLPCRLLARLKFSLTTAGTWNEVPDEISLVPFGSNSIRSEVWVDTGNGTGSTDTNIRRFTNNPKAYGSAITYADSATAGATFTINEEGIYDISYMDYSTTGAISVGISLNDSSNTGAPNLSVSAGLAISTKASGHVNCATVSTRLKPGDVIRANSEPTHDAATAFARFKIVKIAN
jgi:hypothetical protein